MKRIWRLPAAWLLAMPILVLALLGVFGRLTPAFELDSHGYSGFDGSSLPAIFSQIRTFFYPLFLRSVGLFGVGPAAIPVAHWAAAMLSAWVVYWGLRTADYRRWSALWCSVSLMFGRSLIDLGGSITPDSLAISLAVAAAGCSFAAMSRSSSRLGWAGLALFTFFAYQTHPSYLFMILLWPLLCAILDRFLLRRGASPRDRLRRIIWMLAATAIPFASFCSLRWMVVGHWGLVSFGGYNIIGIAGQFLDPGLVEELPPDLRPLGQAIVDRRVELGIVDRRAEGGSDWQKADYQAMELRFNSIVWEAAVPAAQEMHGTDNATAVNRDLSRLSWEVIRRRPGAYLRWLLLNLNHARQQIFVLALMDKGTMMACGLFLLAFAAAFIKGSPTGSESAKDLVDRSRQRFYEAHFLFWSAVCFALARTSLVILVEPANDRYMTGAMVLLPAVAALAVSCYVERVFPAMSAGLDA